MLALLGTDAFSYASGIVIAMAVSRALLPSGRGELAALVYASSIGASIASFGLGKGVLTLASRKRDEAGLVLGAAFSWLPLGMVIGAASCITALSFSGLKGVKFAVPCAAMVAAALATEYCSAAARALEDFKWVLRSRTLQQSLRVGLILALMFGGRLVVMNAFLVECTASTIAALLVAYAVWRDKRSRPNAVPPRGLRYHLLSYGLRYQVFAILWLLQGKIDLFLLRRWGDTAEAGGYAAAVGLTDLISRLPMTIVFVLTPFIAGAEDRARSLTLVTRLTSLVFVPLSALGLIFSIGCHWLIPLLFGGAFTIAVPSARVLGVATVFSGMFLVYASHAITAERFRELWIAVGSGLLLNVGLNAWLIPVRGAEGAALASLASYSLSLLLLAALCGRGQKIGWLRIFVPEKRDVLTAVEAVRRGLRLRVEVPSRMKE